METIQNRKVTPMLPEPTIAKPPPGQPALSRAWVMTPLFCVPDGVGRDVLTTQPPGLRATPPRRTARRANSRPATGRTNRGPTAVKTAPRKDSKDSTDLLAVTAEWLRRALSRSFLRYNVSGDLDAAVHAAMNVLEPVLEARDLEILRLRSLSIVKSPGR